MLRAHVRLKTLDILLRELRRYHQDLGIDVRICAMVDRPSPDVQDCIDFHFARHLKAGGRTLYLPAPFRLLDGEGEHFLDGMNYQIVEMERVWPDMDWIFHADDDRWFEPVQISKELPKALADESVDAYYCKSLFMWGAADTFNTSRHHDSILLYRHQPGARWSGRRMLNIPDELQEQAVMSGRVGTIRTPLLDYGTFSEADRLRVWTAFAVAGKTDAYVKSIYDPPALLRFPADFAPNYGPWRNLWEK